MRLPAIMVLIFALGACGRFGFDALSDQDDPVIEDPEQPQPPPPTGPVSMTLRSPYGSVKDRAIVFHDADGAVLGVELTDASGSATREVPAGAMVTIMPDEVTFLGGSGTAEYRLFTVMGAQPGDAMSLGTDIDPWDTVGTLQVTLGAEVVGASYYLIDVGCGQAYTDTVVDPVQIELNRACFQDASALDVIVYAMDIDDDVLEHTQLEQVPINPDGMTRIDMPAWEYSPAKGEITLRQAPASADDVEVTVSMVGGGVSFYTDDDYDAFEGAGSLASLYFGYARGFGDGLEYFIRLWHDSPPTAGNGSPDDHVSYVLRRVSGIADEITHDLPELLLPTIPTSELRVDVPARPETVFTTSGDLSGADGGFAIVWWADEVGNEYQWWILFPPGQTEVKVPALPDELAAFAPDAQTDWSVEPLVAVFDADFIDDYDHMRNEYGFNLILDEMQRRGTDWMIRVSAGPGGFDIYKKK